MRRLVTWLVLTAIAVVVGFGLAWVALAAVNAVLPPFRYPDDDDTVREFGPVLIAYATWAATALIGSLVAWRWTGARRRPDR